MTKKFTKLPDILSRRSYYKLCREDTGYTLAILADEIGMSSSAIYSWEEGNTAEKNVGFVKWRAALLNLLHTRRDACSRHIDRLNLEILEEGPDEIASSDQ